MNLLRTVLAVIAALVGWIAVLPVLAVGLPFWIVSLLAQVGRKFFSWFEPRVVPWKALIEFEPVSGWKNRSNVDAYGLAVDGAPVGRAFRMTTDEHGWRGRKSLAASDIVVFGDSFAFGHLADDTMFFAERVSGLQVKAIGANGYNLVQELLWMEQLAEQLREKLVVWFIYYGNDLYQNLVPTDLYRYRMPFVRTRDGGGSWEIVTDHVSPSPWPFPIRSSLSMVAEMCVPTFLSSRAFAACEFLIRRGNTVCDNVGATLLVMGIPDGRLLSARGLESLAARASSPDAFDPDLPDRELEKICRQLDVPFVALKEHLTSADYLKDGHWNERGHGRVASLLENLHRTRKSDLPIHSEGPCSA